MTTREEQALARVSPLLLLTRDEKRIKRKPKKTAINVVVLSRHRCVEVDSVFIFLLELIVIPDLLRRLGR